MPQAEPRVGALYSCIEQSKMHEGSPQPTLPESNGEVTLIRFRLDKNPDGSHTIDHGDQQRLPERIEMLRRQSEPIPVYKHVSSASWEYIGRYQVQSITDDAREASQAQRGLRQTYQVRYTVGGGKLLISA